MGSLGAGIISQGEAHEALAMTEIKLGRTSHSLPRRSNSPRRNDLSRRSQTQAEVKTGAKTGAIRT
jgi:hypothetical protein